MCNGCLRIRHHHPTSRDHHPFRPCRAPSGLVSRKDATLTLALRTEVGRALMKDEVIHESPTVAVPASKAKKLCTPSFCRFPILQEAAPVNK